MYGKCGPFGSCNAQDRPICSCFQGFIPTNKDEWKGGNWTSGCTRKTHLQCEQDEFLKLEGLKLPDHFNFFNLPEGECWKTCLTNCSCIAYAVPPGIGCLHWTHNLTDTQNLTYGGDDLNIRLAHSELEKKKKKKKQEHLIIIVITVVMGFILVSICALKLLSKYRGKLISRLLFAKTKEIDDRGYSEEMAPIHDKHGVKLEDLPVFTFIMLSNATENFDCTNKLGQGGFGPVYKGNCQMV
ncbi:G-type lectin S-receptor-like serine/threonine-protein kinase At1g11300 isoform X1 [Salvia splendens]|uniref:G-type lectin S-receptor-like serine/threonine-protein kinase At1g11300 isoform X1 n=1 Tax=Salvia splendens TaxID=180675 RepID=UPI001C258078|nr:G-type lectin S-receptor-like serine/threonine-protein kinase At1g11300 isoform X1 [Salvia splendens]